MPLLNFARFVENPSAPPPHRRSRRVLRGPAQTARCRRSRTSRPPGAASIRRGRQSAGRRWCGRSSPRWRGAAPGRTPRSCGPTTTGAAGTTTCGRRGRARGFRVPALLVSPYAARARSTAPRSTTPRSSSSSRRTGASRRSRGATRAPTASPAPSTSGARRAGRRSSRPPRRRSTIAIRAAGSSTSGTARASCSAPLLIAGAARRRKAMVPFAILVATVVLQPGPPAAQAAAPVPPVIETNPPTPGMRFSVDGVPFRRTLRAAPTRRLRWSARVTPCACSHRPRARRSRTLRSLVRRRKPRRDRGGSPRRVRFADLTGRAVDPGVVNLRDAPRQQRPAARLRRRRAQLASGQPGRARERGPGARRSSHTRPTASWSTERASCTAASSASSPREARGSPPPAPVLGPLRGARRPARLPDRLGRAAAVPGRRVRARRWARVAS